ncbi:tRNA modification GTPase trmE [Panacagrimonas perspica]|uniref:tRNA modification GTPase MnmE n=1 Tax=Panacagrimonas perspica TaxID=381431 RepID=A0A4R7P6Q8_9GAMM|nr:tRNA uridine-5-carboxymethylaminomethyl(34) synthesis GTPase MnmE [Panacagrimonas perspica]TDU28730.1 tRNA modification GTPase trmE [Panacagrimonas perspica]THD05075.1 tRNA uridine-5-carboxymethylaminomethyl(34) synthesis GTPase MnmE [Panacagrimonas perspica]
MSDRSVDTIAAIATAPGRGAVGILRLSGPLAFVIAEKMSGALPAPRTAALRFFHDAQGERCDRGLVLCFDAPRSYTGEAVVEMQGHGGPAVLDLLLGAACAHGARIARPGEFSERAFLNGRLDLAQAEAVADLIDASSRAAVLAAHRALDGEFSLRVLTLARRLLDLRVFVEGALDFSDEDIDWLSDAQLGQGLTDAEVELSRLLAQASQGRRLRDGMVVAIAGRPNVGKSTLLNRLARAEVAIVSEIPGTTRDVLREHLVLDDLPLTMVDTAGLRDTQDPVEAEGIRRAWQAFERAELALFVAEDAAGLTEADRALLAQLPSTARQILVFNKCDLSGAASGAFVREGRDALRICAATGEGLDALRAAIRATAGLDEQMEGVFSARARHLDALHQTQRHLQAARMQLGLGTAAELAAEELRLAHDALGTITGRTTTEDLLGAVFSRFCIGK